MSNVQERKADGFARAHSHRKVLQRWRQITADRKAHYGQQAILAKLAASLQKLRPGSATPSQVGPRLFQIADSLDLHVYVLV